jgi:hypothetical protein
MGPRGRTGRRRLVEYVVTDPFVDLAFVHLLLSNESWLQVVVRQAEVYSSTGDIGEDTATFRTYRSQARQYVIKLLQPSPAYRAVGNYLSEEVADAKASRAWRALITLSASLKLMEKAGVGLGELLPKGCGRFEELLPVVDGMIKSKISKRGAEATGVVKNVLKSLSTEQFISTVPALWWINLVMESEVFEAIFKYHFLASKRELVAGFVKTAEDALSEVKGHSPDISYMEYEVLKALLSRCAELRGQYINKLQNAIAFVKIGRKSVRNPTGWDWFLRDEVLTYAMTAYMVELQELLGLREKELALSTLLSPRKGIYGGAASVLATLILMSPIFAQYSLEARGEVVVTPADIVISVLRVAKSRGRTGDFIVGVLEVAEEVVRFWGERDLLRRLKLYSQDKITPEALCGKSSFTTSLALLVNTGVGGIHITTERKPELRLPPRMTGFDSLYVRAEQLTAIAQRIWRWEG